MRTDKSGSSRNQNFHNATGSKLGGKDQKRKEEVCRPKTQAGLGQPDFQTNGYLPTYSVDSEQIWTGI